MVVTAIGFIVVCVTGLYLDAKADKKRKPVYDQYGNEISSGMTPVLLFVYFIICLFAFSVLRDMHVI